MITKTKISYPVTLSEVKSHLRIDPSCNDDDSYLTTLITVATQFAEDFIEKDIAYTRNVYKIEDFIGFEFEINEGNFKTIETIISDSSVLLTGYEVETHYNTFEVELINSVSSDPLTVTFTTGFDSSTNPCPEIIKQAIKIKVADLYDNERSSYSYTNMKQTNVFERILQPYKGYFF